MKIFDYDDLGSKRSWDYQGDDGPEKDGIEPILTTDMPIDMGQILIINNTAYTVCSMHYKGDNNPTRCFVDRMRNQKVFVDEADPEEQDYKHEVTCPYCGHENSNSWELSDEEDEYECPNCGSTFSYQRNVTVEYCSQPVRKAESTIIKDLTHQRKGGMELESSNEVSRK